MNPLKQLLECGQSYWIDNLTRDMVRGGDLERRWRREGLRGVTSNPTIFHKAISKGQSYEPQIRALSAQGKSLSEVYEEVVTTDIADACDVLRPLYEETEGRDGFVSLEVSPHLAYDTEATIRDARHLHAKVGRPNLMIKVPGTAAGVPAIEELLFEGINVNVTLLFAVESYEAVAQAHVRALERRAKAERPLAEVASVASFFLSRIDTLTDKLLESRIRMEEGVGSVPHPQDLMGKVAVANAKLAYRSYKRLIASAQWKALADKGARPQRLLWASTSTKNPRYRDVMYVEPIVGRDTVNTLPDETIAAFADHGVVVPDAVEQGLDEALCVMDGLGRLGIDFKSVANQLEKEGVQKFIEPFDALMDLLNTKRG